MGHAQPRPSHHQTVVPREGARKRLRVPCSANATDPTHSRRQVPAVSPAKLGRETSAFALVLPAPPALDEGDRYEDSQEKQEPGNYCRALVGARARLAAITVHDAGPSVTSDRSEDSAGELGSRSAVTPTPLLGSSGADHIMVDMAGKTRAARCRVFDRRQRPGCRLEPAAALVSRLSHGCGPVRPAIRQGSGAEAPLR